MLKAHQVLPWTDTGSPAGLNLKNIYVGRDPIGIGAFQVAVVEASSTPSREALKKLFKNRKLKTNIQLVVMATVGDRAWLFGPDEDTATIEAMQLSQAERLLQSALDEPDALAAYARIGQLRRSIDTTGISGFTNNGLFASHHIRENVPNRPDWEAASEKALKLLGKRGDELIQDLGFTASRHAANALLLRGQAAAPQAVAVLLDESEQFDSKSPRFQLSPVAWGLNVASREDVPWLIVLRKDQIRLYPARDGVGVGQKGQSDTYFEIDLAALDQDRAGLLTLIFSADALKAGGTIQELLDGSSKYAIELGARLRERIYENVVPDLSTAVAIELEKTGRELDAEGLQLAYRLTLRLLFRLLFQAYAEDRGLLPAGRNERYDANSLKTIAKRDIDTPTEDFSHAACSLWWDLIQVWNAIDEGNKQWEVPAYNGGLFGTDLELQPEGALLATITLPDSALGPALQALLIDDTEDGVRGPVDFRSLSVREFGTIYEGLLESSLSIATQNLTFDSKGAWVPAQDGDEIWADEGDVYFHSASGERKATGSYFTPGVVVDHLIETSLSPALETHLDRIRELLRDGKEAQAGADFFDFRVADLAMGSGHFLIAAIDRIEAMMRDFLAEPTTQVPSVNAELLRLASSAKDALGKDETAIGEIEPAALLRRQIARRCIYGLDINPIAVELARLAIWIHTFVPGLPMSSLDHGLVCANSLTGIGTIEEAMVALVPERASGQIVAFEHVIEEYLEAARELLLEVAASSEASKKEVTAALHKAKEAREAASPAKAIMDAAIAARAGYIDSREIDGEARLFTLANSDRVQKVAEKVNPAHFPFLFPEVFLRTNPGFDVVVGNPPWEEVMVEEPKFWLRVAPGLMGLRPAAMKTKIKELRKTYPLLVADLQSEVEEVERFRKILLTGPYPGLGTGDIDLYQAFAWRNWQLLRKGGHSGAVYPRSLLNGAGCALWREEVFKIAQTSISTLQNSGHWIFESVHGQYSIALVSLAKDTKHAGSIDLCGPFASRNEFLEGKNNAGSIAFSTLQAASTGGAVPQLPDAKSVELFTQLRTHPRLDEKRKEWDFRPIAEFHATNDRQIFDSGEYEEGKWPVYGGSSFNLWQPDTGEYYAWADPEVVIEALSNKRRNQARTRSSAFYGLPPSVIDRDSTLRCNYARIAFRDVTNATNTRTLIAALVPPSIALTNKAPYLWSVDGDASTEAYLLGVLSSRCLDWYVRRYVELAMSFHILNGLPIPVFDNGSALDSRIVTLSAQLASVDSRYESWAKECGVAVGQVPDKIRKADCVFELEALVALKYELGADQLVHLYRTFHRGWDYEQELASVLTYFKSWCSDG
jgi:hypothetical protein